jgi:hypothetical protein
MAQILRSNSVSHRRILKDITVGRSASQKVLLMCFRVGLRGAAVYFQEHRHASTQQRLVPRASCQAYRLSIGAGLAVKIRTSTRRRAAGAAL